MCINQLYIFFYTGKSIIILNVRTMIERWMCGIISTVQFILRVVWERFGFQTRYRVTGKFWWDVITENLRRNCSPLFYIFSYAFCYTKCFGNRTFPQSDVQVERCSRSSGVASMYPGATEIFKDLVTQQYLINHSIQCPIVVNIHRVTQMLKANKSTEIISMLIVHT